MGILNLTFRLCLVRSFLFQGRLFGYMISTPVSVTEEWAQPYLWWYTLRIRSLGVAFTYKGQRVTAVGHTPLGEQCKGIPMASTDYT